MINFNDSLTRLSIKSFRDIREIPNGGKVVGVHVSGDSLNHLNIVHGDILIIRLTETFAEEKLCVFDTPHGRTAKFAYENFGAVVLHNQADWRQEWKAEEVKMFGVVVRVERDLEVSNVSKQN